MSPDAPAARTRVALIQFETRSLNTPTGYWRTTARLNAAYACQHGYDFLFYHMRMHPHGAAKDPQKHDSQNASEAGKAPQGYDLTSVCYLEGRVGRAASWCALPAVADALSRGYDRVVKLGSDSFLKPDAPDIETILRTHWPTVYMHRWPPESISIKVSPPVFFASNAPGKWAKTLYMPSNQNACAGPNGDFHVWERSVRAWELLRKWWRSNDNCTVPYNQGYLQEQSALTSCRPLRFDEYAVLCKLTWNMPSRWAKLPAVHALHAKGVDREATIASYAHLVPARHEACVAAKAVNRDFNATASAAQLLETRAAEGAFASTPPVPDALGLNGSQWYNGCPGLPTCSWSPESRASPDAAGIHPDRFFWLQYGRLKTIATGIPEAQTGVPGSGWTADMPEPSYNTKALLALWSRAKKAGGG